MAKSDLVRLYLISQGQVLTVKAISLKNQNILKNLYVLKSISVAVGRIVRQGKFSQLGEPYGKVFHVIV